MRFCVDAAALWLVECTFAPPLHRLDAQPMLPLLLILWSSICDHLQHLHCNFNFPNISDLKLVENSVNFTNQVSDLCLLHSELHGHGQFRHE